MRTAARECGSETKDFVFSNHSNGPPKCTCVFENLHRNDVYREKSLLPRSVVQGSRQMFRGMFYSCIVVRVIVRRFWIARISIPFPVLRCLIGFLQYRGCVCVVVNADHAFVRVAVARKVVVMVNSVGMFGLIAVSQLEPLYPDLLCASPFSSRT